jgi:tetratricopeptide (TPR) repeat protein
MADAPLAALEKLQGQLPSHLARPDLAELAVLLRYAEHGAWAFAIYNTVPVRDEVAGVLRELLATLPVYEFSLSAQQPNPLACLEMLPAAQERAVVFFFDLEQTGGAVWGYLEMQRENLAARPLGLVFWISRQAWTEGVRAAPNFWSQRSGVFDFTIESPAVLSEVRGAWAGQPVQLDSPADWERQFRLFSGLLREYEDEAAPPAAQAELHGKIAYLLNFADRQAEAAAHLRQQLELARQANDRRQQVEAMNNLGWVAQFQQGRTAALDWYQQALAAAGSDRRSRAESLRNLASALLWEGQPDQALTMLREALDLFRAVGSRLGEANTLKAIGDVQRFKDENEAALDSYQQALTLFRAVGDRLGEANTLLTMGDLAKNQEEWDKSWQLYEQTLALYHLISDNYSQARVLYRMGDWQAAQGQKAEAAKFYRAAISLWSAIGLNNLIEQILQPRLQAVSE